MTLKGCQALESGPRALSGPAVFTNEGSKKRKKGAGRTGGSPVGEQAQEELDFPLPSMGVPGMRGSICLEKR